MRMLMAFGLKIGVDLSILINSGMIWRKKFGNDVRILI